MSLSCLIVLLSLPLAALSLRSFTRTLWRSPLLSSPPPSSTVLYSSAFPQELSLGAPQSRPESGEYLSPAGVLVEFNVSPLESPKKTIDGLIDRLDNELGVLLTSSYEIPGRYARWSVGFVAPAVQIVGRGYCFSILALNDRGVVLVKLMAAKLSSSPALFSITESSSHILTGSVIPSSTSFPEEERSKQPSLFSLVRAVKETFATSTTSQLGLYGALGYDLTFQFEEIPLKKPRDSEQRDVVLYLPDELLVVDNQKYDAWKVRFEFSSESVGVSTRGLERAPSESPFKLSSEPFEPRDSPRGAYAASVVAAKEQFRVGNLFEVVLSQVFRHRLDCAPSKVFRRLSRRNPSPYGFFMNLGRNEYLIGASPEMFVRVERSAVGLRVETCPISGTIERGESPLEDAQQIKKLLQCAKEESELTMCTDVDRNDKSRICEPGSVRVLGRRQIEMYSRLIHTVDHVEGYLRAGFDALDAFLCHTWAVTVTGAPKTWAIRFIEATEASARHWYGGAVGMIGFDGTLNTGLTLRTIRVTAGIAEVRAGATLLHESTPAAEEAETELKASALIDAIQRPEAEELGKAAAESSGSSAGKNKKILLVDHEDSFVHTLANYVRQTGAEVVTCRSGPPLLAFIRDNVDSGIFHPDLVVLSPGPGSPSDFKLKETISAMISRKVPIFGVCLGLQGLVEYFDGELGILPSPMHGKPSQIHQKESSVTSRLANNVLTGLPSSFVVARYHSLFGKPESLPNDLLVTAESSDGVVMAVQHASMPIAAVQFHPESILTSPTHGMQILINALEKLKSEHYSSVNVDSFSAQQSVQVEEVK